MELINLDFVFIMVCTLITSSVAGILGQGGGLLLIGVLSIYLDAPLLIAFHGVIQLFSNSSRAYFALSSIQWKQINPILLGTVLGAFLIIPFLSGNDLTWLEPLIGVYILQQVWIKQELLPVNLPKPLLAIGFLQGSLGMIIGATGPLANAVLYNLGLSKNQIVASNAVIMSVSHLVKVALYMIIGVNLLDSFWALTCLGIMAITGSKLGTLLRHKVSEAHFMALFEVILSLLALRMILNPLI